MCMLPGRLEKRKAVKDKLEIKCTGACSHPSYNPDFKELSLELASYNSSLRRQPLWGRDVFMQHLVQGPLLITPTCYFNSNDRANRHSTIMFHPQCTCVCLCQQGVQEVLSSAGATFSQKMTRKVMPFKDHVSIWEATISGRESLSAVLLTLYVRKTTFIVVPWGR